MSPDSQRFAANRSTDAGAEVMGPSAMEPVFIQAFAIGFVGAILFLAIDMFERNILLANLLKALVLIVGGMAIAHKLSPPLLGVALF